MKFVKKVIKIATVSSGDTEDNSGMIIKHTNVCATGKVLLYSFSTKDQGHCTNHSMRDLE